MYDWERIIADKVPCYFWDLKYACDINKHVSRLRYVESYVITDTENSTSYRLCTGTFYYNYDGGRYHNCEPIRTEDKAAYKIKEPGMAEIEAY